MPDLDLEAIKRTWLNQCGPCDYGMPEYGCTHPQEDYRPVIMSLVLEVERLRAPLVRKVRSGGAFADRDTIKERADAGEIEIANIRGWAWRCWGCDVNEFDFESQEAAEAAAHAHVASRIHQANVRRPTDAVS